MSLPRNLKEENDPGKRIVQRTQQIAAAAKVRAKAPQATYDDDDGDSEDEESSSDEYDSEEDSDTDIDAEEFEDEWAGSESEEDREVLTSQDVIDEVDDDAILAMVEQTPQATSASMSMSGGKIIEPKKNNLRRSKRNRWQPLKYWKGERLRVEKDSTVTEEAIKKAKKSRRYSLGVGAFLRGYIESVKTKVVAVQDEHFKTRESASIRESDEEEARAEESRAFG